MTRLNNNSQLQVFNQRCFGVNVIEAELPRYDRQISSIVWRIRSNPNSLASTTPNSTRSLRSLHSIADIHHIYVNPAIKSTAFKHPTGSPQHERTLRQNLPRVNDFVLFFAFARCSSKKMKWCEGLYRFRWVLGAAMSRQKTFGCYFFICYMHFSKGKRAKLYDMQISRSRFDVTSG